MLSFKQYLIEKQEDTKYGGMNVPLDLADFPDNQNGSMISPVNFSGTALNPIKYTRTDRDAYDAAVKLKNEKILANNKKFGLSDEIDETPFEDAFKNTRKYIENTVMDPNNKDGDKRSPEDMSPSKSDSNRTVDNILPDLGKKGLLGSILNPEYKMNYIEYKYNEQEIEGDSEEEEIDEYSRDNIEEYIAKENEYSEEGINLKKYREYYEN